MKRYKSHLDNSDFLHFAARQCVVDLEGKQMNAFDATAGNGHDTLWLAELVGDNGRVFAVDIQECALSKTRQRLQEANLEHRVSLFLSGHEKMAYLLPEEVKGHLHLAIYNLGYLPGGDKSVKTLPETTLQSLNECKNWLAPGGMILLTVYPGHVGGEEETEQVGAWIASLDSRYWRVVRFQALNRQSPAPFVYVVEATPLIEK